MKIIVDNYLFEALKPSEFRELMQVGRDLAMKRIEHNKVKYGNDNPEYVKTLVNLLDKAQEDKTRIFRLDSDLYPDAGKQFTVSNPNDVPPERILEHFRIRNYTINKDGTVDVDGDVNLSRKGLTEIPIKFGVVKGAFFVDNNNLLSLKNSPSIVTGVFDCNYNKQLSSLKSGPKSAESYYCTHCDLKSLEGVPNEVIGTFDCSGNKKLTSLKYAPEKVGCINCSGCRLISLEGAPKEVTDTFDCSGNKKLTSLKYAPEKVRYINCSGCRLTSLEGTPKEAEGFICSGQVNEHKFTEEEVRKVCDVKYHIKV